MRIEIKLTEEEMEEVDDVWEIAKERVPQKTLEALEWDNKEAFLSDIFRFGMNKSSEDPVTFVRGRILGEFPAVKGREEDYKEELKKIYG